MSESKNQYAIITGASRGIGKAIAIELARKHFNLILLARSGDELKDLQNELTNAYAIDVRFLAIDLSLPGAVKHVSQWITAQSLPIHALINNAGYGLWGQFDQLSIEPQLEMCDLNINTLVELCHLLIPLLLKEKQSYILNVSSTAAYQAVPALAVYSATKAFVLSFTRALRYELKNTSISVSCLCPGPVDTGFAKRAGLDAFSELAEKFNMQPGKVAEVAVKGLLSRKAEIIPGASNALSAFATRLVPKSWVERIAAGLYKT